jgi:hypothetical protein
MFHFSVDPALAVEEESLVAAQAALTFFFHDFKDKKVSEDMSERGAVVELQPLREHAARPVQAPPRPARPGAGGALKELHPVLARAASLFHVLDRQVDAIMSGYDRKGGLGGGFELDAGTAWPGPLNDSRRLTWRPTPDLAGFRDAMNRLRTELRSGRTRSGFPWRRCGLRARSSTPSPASRSTRPSTRSAAAASRTW